MQHHIVAHIDANMGRAAGVIGLFKEDQIAGLCVCRRDIGAHASEPLRAEPSEIPMQTAVVVDIRNKSGAVKGRSRRAAAPHIGEAEILFRLRDNGGELFVRQRFRGYLVLFVLGVVIPVHIHGIRKQVGTVAEGAHIHGVHGELIVGHDVYRHMGEVEVFQLHMVDIVGVWNLHIVFVFLRIALAGLRVCNVPGACPGLGAVSCLRRDALGEDILLFKERIQNAAHGSDFVDKQRKMVYNKCFDKAQFERYKEWLGSNAPKTFEEFQKLKYSDDWQPFKAYTRSIKSGELTPLADFKLYKETSTGINNALVGKVTSNGITITGKSDHFIARTIGSVEQRRNGVSIADALDTVIHPEKVDPIRINENGKSQRFIGKTAAVTINPDTDTLIQANPIHKSKKAKEVTS